MHSEAVLSKRLLAAADFVPEGCRPVDVGTDHGYLPIYLVQTRKACRAVASDVREGPLSRARGHIAEAGLEKQIETRLSDGLSDIPSGAGDVLIITGMGGMLMLKILRAGDLSGFHTLILSPQSDYRQVRYELMQMDLKIIKETLVCEDGKYYPVICAVHGIDTDDDPVHLRYGKKLRPEAYPVLDAYLRTEHTALSDAVLQIRRHAKEKAAAADRLCELKEMLCRNEEAQRRLKTLTAV